MYSQFVWRLTCLIFFPQIFWYRSINRNLRSIKQSPPPPPPHSRLGGGGGIKLNRFLRHVYKHLKIVWMIWNHKQILQRMRKAKIYNIKAQKLQLKWKRINKFEANKATFFCTQRMKSVLHTILRCCGEQCLISRSKARASTLIICFLMRQWSPKQKLTKKL